MYYWTKMNDDGTVDLPEELLEKIGVRPGDLLTLDMEGDLLVIRRAQDQDQDLPADDDRPAASS